MCSPGAQALWMRMLCVCAKADGYLMIAGKKLNADDMATQTGWPAEEVRKWWAELAKWEVFSVEGRGKVYSRKMVKDQRKAEIARENGKNGGNPNLRKCSTSDASDNQEPTKLPGSLPDTISQKEGDADASLSDCDPTRPDLFAEPDREAPPEKPQRRQVPTKAELDAIWEITPRIGRERSGRRDLERALTAAMRRGHDPAAVTRGLELAYASPTYSGDHAKGVHRLIEADRWQSFLEGEQPSASTLPPWPGPAEIRAAIVRAKDEGFARSYLDPSGWRNGPDRVVLCRNEIAASRLNAEVPEVLQRHEARAVFEGRT
jgi:hypothetical protein